jgi:type I restriction enzyme S subunit
VTWTAVPLADVAEIQGGIQKQPKRAPKHNAFPFLRVANVTARGLDLGEVHAIELFDGELQRYQLRRGDLLVVEGNGSASQIGRAAVWDGSVEDAVHQNHLIRVRPGPQLDDRFLGLVWNSPAIRDELSRVASSTSGLHTLSVAKLKRITLPLPPLVDQRRIVDLLEDHLSRLDAADEYMAASRRRVKRLQTALLSAALARTSVEERPLADLLQAPLANGRSVPTQRGGFPVLRLNALQGGQVDLSQRKTGAWTRSEAERWLVQRGDFLIARGNGSLHLVGRGGLVVDEPDDVAFPDTLIRARLNLEKIKPAYLALIWNAPIVRRQIETSARTTAGIYKVNQRDLAGVRIPVPSTGDQAAIVDRVGEQRETLGRLGEELQHAAARSQSLRRSLLTAAFSDRLTTERTAPTVGVAVVDDSSDRRLN